MNKRWNLYPWCLALGMGVVISVNMGMVYAALSTFPGIAGSDGFDLSNHYDKVLSRVKQRDDLGWRLTVAATPEGRPVIELTGPAGNALAGARVMATAERPVGDAHTTPVTFIETVPGHYAGQATLDEKGQWDIAITASAGGHDFVTTRRLIAR